MKIIGPRPGAKSRSKALQKAIIRRQIKADIIGKIRAADKETLENEGLAIARQFSSGTYTLKFLAQRPFPNHPYAVARPNSAFDPAMISTHTGKFLAGWKIKPTGPNDPPAIWNTSRVAKFLEFGTKTMKRRPIDEAIIAALAPIRKRNLDQAFSDGTFAMRKAA